MAKPKKDPNFPMQGKGGGMGGKYARKAENLTAKQLKAAGAKKAAAKRTVSISDTKRVTEGANKGRTLGPGGKPLTGSVRLQNGNMAVYKNGKRVVAAPKAKPASSSSSRRGTSSSASSRTPSRTTTVTATVTKPKGAGPDKSAKAARAAAASRREANRVARASGQVPSATRSYPNGADSTSSAAARKAKADAAARASGQVPSATRSYPNGANAAGPKASKSRAEALGLNPATGGSRSNPSPYVNSSSQNQRNVGKPPTSTAGASPNKRGGGMGPRPGDTRQHEYRGKTYTQTFNGRVWQYGK